MTAFTVQYKIGYELFLQLNACS